ncbi:MAG: prepilin-type N-terminal cleavage/methylation domain-containing protein [Candidatus Eisenbacteria bacterium]
MMRPRHSSSSPGHGFDRASGFRRFSSGEWSGVAARSGRTGAGITGFTLIELMIVVVIIGILSTLSVIGYTSLIDRARVISAMADIKKISVDIDNYRMINGTLPASLAAVGLDGYLDPGAIPTPTSSSPRRRGRRARTRT